MTIHRLGELENVIGQVAASYEAGRLIDSLSSAQLPNKRQVIESLGHLKGVMYLGYYATGTLDESKLRFAIASHLYPACETLVEQIRRAASYEGFRTATPREAEWPETVTLALFRKIPALRALLSKDVLAAFQGDPAANSVEEVIFSYPSIEAITTHRIAHELYREGVPMLPRIMSEHAHEVTGIDIHPGASIGESFFIDHGTGVVIGETCVIGNEVKIYQGVTLGALSLDRGGSDAGTKRHPTIEDNVTIYAGATILGGTPKLQARAGAAEVAESAPLPAAHTLARRTRRFCPSPSAHFSALVCSSAIRPACRAGAGGRGRAGR
ncbi:MAG: serine acetyltransferase [Deltaproteobacteria bacterium]|nr:MAG: serine acetyltransferase [Deltaproteobacteria bacterium]